MSYNVCGIYKQIKGLHISLETLMYEWLQVYIEMNQPVMAASLCLELGNALKVQLWVNASIKKTHYYYIMI